MKHPKLLTIAAATVVVGSSAFVASGTATAATLPGQYSTDYVNSTAQLTPNDGVIPTGTGWQLFTGEGSGTPTFGLTGATTPAPTEDAPFSSFVLTHATTAPIGSLADVVSQTTLVGSGTVAPFYIITDGDETDLVGPADLFDGDASTGSYFADDAQWVGYEFEGGGADTLQAEGTIAEVQAQIEAHSPDYSIVGYAVEGIDFSGLTLPSAETVPLAAADADAPLLSAAAVASTPATITTLSVNNATTHFTPTPTISLGTASTTVKSFTTTGVTVSATGFLPGETVTSGYGTGASGDALPATFVADANGAVSGTIVGPSDATPLTYSLVLIGSTSGVSAVGSLTVIADPTAIAPVPTPIRAAATFAG